EANDTVCLDQDGDFEDRAACAADAYMALVPADPGSTSYTYTSAAGATYAVVATLEGTMSSLGPGNVTLSPSGIQ
ncbi:MAG: hypothetical protein HOG08_02160, partial [Candidatus Magasanikbacteria bacterium]|nr:hypothetical protein [Candidatus Magasanikbacteria bacterium]